MSLAPLIESTLGSPRTELAIRAQMLDLARKNLHDPAVLTALLNVVPKLANSETRRPVLDLLLGLDPARFSDLHAFHDQLLAILATERERDHRIQLLNRLASGLHQDPRLPSAFIELLARPDLSDPERETVTSALAHIPAVTPETAIAALNRAAQAPAALQSLALTLAENVPEWNDALATAATSLLRPATNRNIRERVLKRLEATRRLGPEAVPTLCEILHTDTDASMRASALELLAKISPTSGPVFVQFVWTASKDRDETLRARAITLQKNLPELSPADTAALADRLFADADPDVRAAILDTLAPYLREPSVRAALARAFENPHTATDPEFERITTALLPYAGREPAIRDSLLAAAANDPQSSRRTSLLQKLLPRLRIEENLPWIAERFTRERTPAIREHLFNQIKALSISRHPALIALFSGELREPSSPYRQRCAAVLAPSIETSPEIVAAMEDVLLNDTDRELVRTCLDAYLKPGITPRFEILRTVIATETNDLANRKAALDKLTQTPLSAGEQSQLAATLQNSPL